MSKDEEHDILSFFNKYSHIIVLICVTIAFLLTNNYITKDLKTVPACIYGCDLHQEMGLIMDAANNPIDTWQSPAHGWLGFVNNGPKASFIFRGAFYGLVSFTHMEVWQSLVLLTYFLLILGMIGWYLFYKNIFTNKYLIVLFSAISISLSSIPYFKYSSIISVFLPYTLLSFIMIFEIRANDKLLKKILVGLYATVMIVFISNIHAMGLFIVYFFLGLGYIYLVWETLIPKKIFSKFKEADVRHKSYLFFIVMLISILLNFLLGWWYKIIFVFGGNDTSFRFDIQPSLNDIRNYFHFTFDFLRTIFFNFSDAITTIMSILALAGFLLLFFVKTEKVHLKYIKWIVMSFLVSVFSYIITVPLFHRHLSPQHSISFLLPMFWSCMLGLLFVLVFYKYVKNSLYQKIFLFIIIILYAVYAITIVIAGTKGGFWDTGKEPPAPNYIALKAWYTTNNINPSDTILMTTNELSFAVFGYTGTKLFIGRQSHFFHFGDFQNVWMDAALIYYGNDSTVRYSLLKYYDNLAKSQNKKLYLYWDYYWIQSEWQQGSNGGNNAYPFDPIRFEYSNERENLLKNNNISYYIVKNGIFEPSAQGSPYATKMDIIYLTPDNYRNANTPWNADLDKYLKPVWKYNNNNVSISVLYEINVQ